MSTLNAIQDHIIEDFSLFENRNDSYAYIIELGKKLPDFSEQYRTDDYIVKGCQSRVWLIASYENETVKYQADSDSTLVKGLVSLLVNVLSGKSPVEILQADLYFIEKIGLREMLSMNRANGLNSMIKQMKMYALAFQTAKA